MCSMYDDFSHVEENFFYFVADKFVLNLICFILMNPQNDEDISSQTILRGCNKIYSNETALTCIITKSFTKNHNIMCFSYRCCFNENCCILLIVIAHC